MPAWGWQELVGRDREWPELDEKTMSKTADPPAVTPGEHGKVLKELL